MSFITFSYSPCTHWDVVLKEAKSDGVSSWKRSESRMFLKGDHMEDDHTNGYLVEMLLNVCCIGINAQELHYFIGC